MLKQLRQIIRENRRATPFRLTASACEKFLRAWYNEGFYDFKNNGETFVAHAFNRWLDGRRTTIWDVGANAGQWAIEISSIIPTADVHSFEIIESIRAKLKSNTSGAPNIHVEEAGLSDAPGSVVVHWNSENEVTSSVSPRFGTRWIGETTAITCEVTTADLLYERIGAPAFLKIDVEGHELSVLRGAQHMLASADAPVLVQMEYGETYIPTGSTLKALYALVEPHGFAIGRLYPNHVDFKSYSFSDDHFRLGNYIAVRDERLKALLV